MLICMYHKCLTFAATAANPLLILLLPIFVYKLATIAWN